MPVSLADDTPHGAVTGQVIDRNGIPLANATVQICDFTGYVIGSTVSSSNGTYAFNTVPITGFDGRDTFRVMAKYNVSDKTYSDKTEFFWIYKNQLTTHDVVIYYYPPSGYGWLTGKVVNANNFNQYMQSTIYLSNGMYYFISGEPGDNWHFYLPEGNYQVWAEHNENGKTYSSGKTDVTVMGDDTNTVVLMVSLAGNGSTLHVPPAANTNVVHGVIKQKNNDPLYGARVELCKLTGGSLDPVMSTTSDVDGAYQFKDVNISSPMENFAVRTIYNFMGTDNVTVSNTFTVYYNNMLNVSHDYEVPLIVGFVDSGSLELLTNPPGASIFIDGSDTGRLTPFNITGIKAGDHRVSLILDGYLPENLTVNVPSENTIRITKQMKPSTGDVYFNVKPGDSSVYVNGVLKGTGSINMTKLQYGKYSYVVSRDGFRNVTGTFEVLPGDHLDVPVELVAVPGLSLTYIGYLIDGIFTAIGNIF